MRHMNRWLKLVIFDVLGVLFILAAALTGWLPGPGGIPLFLIGLSLLAVHHDWAKRYINLFRKYADHVSDLIFIANPRVRLAFDVVGPLLLAAGVVLLFWHDSLWVISLGLLVFFLGLTVLLGNRDRYKRLKRWLRNKH